MAITNADLIIKATRDNEKRLNEQLTHSYNPPANAQPKWRCVANIGDVNPVEYGGFFVGVDENGVYDPEAIVLDHNEDTESWTVYRFTLEAHTYQDKVLSDNPYHSNQGAWYDDKLTEICETMGIDELCLISQLCSHNPIDRAAGYSELVLYFGPHEFDEYPLEFESEKSVRAYLRKYVTRNIYKL